LVFDPVAGASPLFPPHYPNADKAKQALLAVVPRDPSEYGCDRNRWGLSALRQALPLLGLGSDAGLCRLFGRWGIVSKRARYYVHSPDPDYEAKLALLESCLQQSRDDPQAYPLLYLDKLTYYRQPSLSVAYEVRGGARPLADRSYRSNSTMRVGAAMDVVSGKVVCRQSRRLGRAELVRLYRDTCQAYPRAVCIYLVGDNWPVHYHPDVLAALMPQQLSFPVHLSPSWPKEPRPSVRRLNLPIRLLPLPTYAPWTNPIEKLWRWLYQTVLHLHRLADDFRALADRVAAFLDQFACDSTDRLRCTGLRTH